MANLRKLCEVFVQRCTDFRSESAKMGLFRFFKQLNCFGCRKRKEKSIREMKIEMHALNTKSQELQEDVDTKRRIVHDCIKQKEAEEKHKVLKILRIELMAKVEEVEMKLQRQLHHRQMVLAEVIECNVRKIAREKKIEAAGRKARSFMKELETNKQITKIWKENLRRVRSQSDINKAAPQPPLVPHAGQW